MKPPESSESAARPLQRIRRKRAFRAFNPRRRPGSCNTPIPGIEISTTSPLTTGPTPDGVPVAIKSPGLSVITCEMNRKITSSEKK